MWLDRLRPYSFLCGSLAGIFLAGIFAGPGWCEADPALTLSSDPAWHRLLHYRAKTLGGYRSQVDDPQFFISPEGQTHPEAELRATLEAFRAPADKRFGRLNQLAHCAFPARFAWLNTQLELPMPQEPCVERDEWIAGIGAKSVTLVFSSAYPNNPASMFGHTLLRLNGGDGKAILNYGANFEARTDGNDSALIYAFKGLFGLYPGEFSLVPYYMKVNEYSYSESRDLWEYDLKLNQPQVDQLVRHLWELYSTGGFAYFFLDENCSYQLLALLEVADPSLDLTSGPWFVALPVDTLKRVSRQPGAITAEKLRSSLHRTMAARMATLSSEQRESLSRLMRSQEAIASATDPQVLDAIITMMDYRRRKLKGQLPPEEEGIFRASLLQRAKLGGVRNPDELNSVAEVPESPLLMHEPQAVQVGVRSRSGVSALRFGIRLGFHHLLDPDPGFPTGFQVEVGTVGLELGLKDRVLRLGELKFFDLLSLHPMNSVDRQISWALRAGAARRLDYSCSNCLGVGIEAGPGIALSFWRQRLWFFSLVTFNADYVPDLLKSGRFGPSFETGVSLRAADRFKVFGTVRFQAELNRPLDRAVFDSIGLEGALTLGRDRQLRAGGRWVGTWMGQAYSGSEWGVEVRQFF